MSTKGRGISDFRSFLLRVQLLCAVHKIWAPLPVVPIFGCTVHQIWLPFVAVPISHCGDLGGVFRPLKYGDHCQRSPYLLAPFCTTVYDCVGLFGPQTTEHGLIAYGDYKKTKQERAPIICDDFVLTSSVLSSIAPASQFYLRRCFSWGMRCVSSPRCFCSDLPRTM